VRVALVVAAGEPVRLEVMPPAVLAARGELVLRIASQVLLLPALVVAVVVLLLVVLAVQEAVALVAMGHQLLEPLTQVAVAVGLALAVPVATAALAS